MAFLLCKVCPPPPFFFTDLASSQAPRNGTVKDNLWKVLDFLETRGYTFSWHIADVVFLTTQRDLVTVMASVMRVWLGAEGVLTGLF